MGLGNLNPGGGATLDDAYGGSGCQCCCDATLHAGQISKSFFPWIRKIRLSTPQGSQDFDSPNTGDSWSLTKVDTYTLGSFGLSTDTFNSSVLSPLFSCHVEWYGYTYPGSPAGRYRDNTCTGQTHIRPVATSTALLTFACVGGKPTVRMTLGTGHEMSVQLSNSPGGGVSLATDPPIHSGFDTFVRHSSDYLWKDSSEVESSVTYETATIPLLGNRVFNPDMGAPGGILVPSYGPTNGATIGPRIFYTYGEGQQFAYNEMPAVLAPVFNPIGILGVTVELLP